MTPDQALLILKAHYIDDILDDPEETAILRKQNPELLDAYQALKSLANDAEDD